MQCSEIRELLSAYIDEVLDEQEKTAVADHVRTCRACFQELTDLQETIKLLRSLGEIAPPEGFRKQLKQRLLNEPAPALDIDSVVSRRGRLSRWLSRSRAQLAAAVIIIALGISIGLYNLSQGGIKGNAQLDVALNTPKSQRSETAQAPPRGEQPKALRHKGVIPETPETPEGKGGMSAPNAASQTQSEAGPAARSATISSQETGDKSEGLNPEYRAPSPAQPGTAEQSPDAAVSSVEPAETGESRADSGTADDNIKPASPDLAVKALGIRGSEQSSGGESISSEEVQRTPDEELQKHEGVTPDDMKIAYNQDEQVQNDGNQSGQELTKSKQTEVKQPTALTPKNREKIVKDAFLRLEVRDYKETSSKLSGIIQRFGAYIENSSENVDGLATASFVIKVPAKNFSDLVGAIEALGRVTDKQVSAKNVSEDQTGAEAKLRSLEIQEQRLLALVDKTTALKEVLALENELTRVREEIEILKDRLKSLESAVLYSTVKLEIKEVPATKPDSEQGTQDKAANNFRDSFPVISDMLSDAVSFIGWFLLWALAAGAAGGAVYYCRKKKKS